MSKPSVLILGGVGVVGRFLLAHILKNDLASGVRVVDKALPQTSYLDEAAEKAFQNPLPSAVKGPFAANALFTASIKRCFTRENGEEFDYVFNFAQETKYSQSDEIYKERVVTLTSLCAQEAASRGVKVFVHLSTGEIYDADKEKSTEDSKVKPWTLLAKYKLQAEEELEKMSNLDVVILRPAMLYGPGAMLGITPRLIIGRVYKELQEEMKFLWIKDLRINTVHVLDVALASWQVADWYVQQGKSRAGDGVILFNLCDKSDTNQETINEHIRSLFGIETGFHGTVISNFARLNLESVTEDINEKHVKPWGDLLAKAGITSSPLTPFLDKELLYNNALSIDGTKIERVVGYQYQRPYVTRENLQEIIDNYQAIGQLISMGFPEVRVQKAWKATNGAGLQPAMDWLLAHSDDPNIDDPIPPQHSGGKLTAPSVVGQAQSAGSQEGKCEQTAQSLKCDDCGKLFRDAAGAERHAMRTEHTNFSESTMAIKPLTEEEKAQKLKELKEKLAAKRAERELLEKEEEKSKEKVRRKTGQEMAAIKEKIEQEEMRKTLEAKRREKAEDKAAKERVLAQIAADRAERAARQAAQKQGKPYDPETATTTTPAAPKVAAPKKDYTETRIQIRLDRGAPLTQVFKTDDTLSAVHDYVASQRGDSSFKLSSNFPRKLFREEDMSKTLKELNLVPSAALLIVPQ
ncbi:hypothetical protein BZG36_01180 [Bifiguratus adelaidae]|uniref:UBX domain-containing protein n=1 Tax=Bifiguratus adelaidae TaxID=1938954 RepID=A0A261Y636_9FUNG|nr:hypothetical protein BZG36_01180 [Bifiguratus adelaidae]